MASKWSQMTEAERAEIKAKNTEYRHARKAKELGISLEDYRERLEAKRLGKTSKEAGLVNPAAPSRIPKLLQNEFERLMSKAEKAEGTDLSCSGNSITLLFRSPDKRLYAASFWRENPREGQRATIYFVNPKNKKRRPFMKEDYDNSTGRKNAAATNWSAAEVIL